VNYLSRNDSEFGFSIEGERRYYRSAPATYPGYKRLLPYLRLLDPQPVELFAGKKVLDIGAGECAYTGLIASEFRPLRVVALELIRERMLPAKRFLPSETLAFVQGSCYELPFADASFDLVFGDLILHHLPNLRAVVRGIRRVLRRDGSYVGLEPNFLNPLQAVLHLLGGHSDNEYQLRPSSIREVFCDCGFRTVDIRHVWVKFPSLRNRLLTSSVAIHARVSG